MKKSPLGLNSANKKIHEHFSLGRDAEIGRNDHSASYLMTISPCNNRCQQGLPSQALNVSSDLAHSRKDGSFVQGGQLPVAHDGPAVDDRVEHVGAPGRVDQVGDRIVEGSDPRLQLSALIAQFVK